MQFEIPITSDFLWSAYRDQIFRHRWALAIAFVAVGAIVVSDAFRGELSTVSQFSILVFGTYGLMSSAALIRYRGVVKQWKEKQGADPVRYAFEGGKISTKSNLGTADVSLDAFTLLEISDRFVRLYLRNGGAVTIPAFELNDVQLEWVKSECRSSGVTIKDHRRANNRIHRTPERRR